jgi:hypothetical protein
MTVSRPPQYDAEISVCGDVVFMRRSLGLLRRIEQRFGPLPTLFRALETADVTQSTIAGLYEELVRGADDAPRLPEIQSWIYAEGSFKTAKALAQIVGELAVGSAQLRAYEDKRMAEAEERNPRKPAPTSVPAEIGAGMAPTAASRGAR